MGVGVGVGARCVDCRLNASVARVGPRREGVEGVDWRICLEECQEVQRSRCWLESLLVRCME